jgi:hypothetical protein
MGLNWVSIQAQIQDFTLGGGALFGEGSVDRLGPQRVQGTVVVL